MNTIAQEFIEQGMQQGVQQGIEASRRNIRELLSIRLGVPLTQFQEPLTQINDLDSLSVLIRRAATVSDVTQFEQALLTILTE